MSREDKVARNVVVLTFILVFSMLILLMLSCSNKNVSAHGQDSDYYYELEQDKLLK